jgi:hypothetical protein
MKNSLTFWRKKNKNLPLVGGHSQFTNKTFVRSTLHQFDGAIMGNLQTFGENFDVRMSILRETAAEKTVDVQQEKVLLLA